MLRRSRNHHLSGKFVYTGENNIPTKIHFIQFGPSSFTEKRTDNVKDISSLISDQYVSWIRVNGMSDPELILKLVKDFGLNTINAKDILSTDRIVSIEEYDENIFISLPVVYINDKKEDVNEHVSLILGKNYVISFQESNFPLFENIYATIKDNSTLKINSKKADFLLANMLFEIICSYGDVIGRLEDAVEDQEDELLDINKINDNQMSNIQELRRKIIRLRKQLAPFKDQFIKLTRVEKSLISKQEIPFYKDIYNQLLFNLQNLESFREIIASLVDLYLNNNDLKMNIVMKQLTAVATIFIPLTFIVGLWGMNFRFMPELEWKYGYLFAWIIIIVCGIIVWIYLKRKNWF